MRWTRCQPLSINRHLNTAWHSTQSKNARRRGKEGWGSCYCLDVLILSFKMKTWLWKPISSHRTTKSWLGKLTCNSQSYYYDENDEKNTIFVVVILSLTVQINLPLKLLTDHFFVSGQTCKRDRNLSDWEGFKNFFPSLYIWWADVNVSVVKCLCFSFRPCNNI